MTFNNNGDEPFYTCPNFESCGVNNCPLWSRYPLPMKDSKDDRERKCTLSRKKREKIARNYPGKLKYNGLTVKEHGGMKSIKKHNSPP